ncbi:hypothetical protein [Nocardioides sp. SYSU DS0651]|uniref:hypothetical protein n=1 Tax=Nocardioides sp. SYSU DS0651 TaxID=3415955 RepID=UPI003F4C7BCF
MIGHLGNRVSALLDGQLSAKETEEAWAHVYACHACRDLVEREGWVKTRLAGLSGVERCAPSDLKGSLLSMPPGDAILAGARSRGASRRHLGAAVVGGGAVGAAMVGVLALGFAPGSAPADRRPPATQINTTVPASPSTPAPGPASGGAPSTSPGGVSVVHAPLRRMLP